MTQFETQTAPASIYDWRAIFAAGDKTREACKRQFYIDRAGERDGNALYKIFDCEAWSARGGDFWAWARAKFGKGFCVSRADFVAGLEIFIEGDRQCSGDPLDDNFESIIECAKSDLGAEFLFEITRANFFIFDAAADSVWDYRSENSNGDFTREAATGLFAGGCVDCGNGEWDVDTEYFWRRVEGGRLQCYDCALNDEYEAANRGFGERECPA